MQALWMIVGALLFAAMAVCVKFASASFNSAELIFYRGVVGMLFLWLLARRQGVTLRTRYPGMHAWRSFVGVVSLGAWFYSLARLPIATSLTLNYMSSIWIAAFLLGGSLLAWNPRRGSPVVLGQGPLALTVVTGFAGVVMMLKPTIAQDQMYAALVGLMSGVTAAFAYMQVMALGKIGEPETRAVFYFAVGSAVGGAVAVPFTGASAWHWPQALWLLPIGLLAAAGQLCMTRAYNRGPTLVVASLQYSGIIFGAVFGVVLFEDRLTPTGWAGMGLIVASGIMATVLRSWAAPDAPAEEH